MPRRELTDEEKIAWVDRQHELQRMRSKGVISSISVSYSAEVQYATISEAAELKKLAEEIGYLTPEYQRLRTQLQGLIKRKKEIQDKIDERERKVKIARMLQNQERDLKRKQRDGNIVRQK